MSISDVTIYEMFAKQMCQKFDIENDVSQCQEKEQEGQHIWRDTAATTKLSVRQGIVKSNQN